MGYRFQERIEPLREGIAEEVMRVIDEELGKLAGLEQSSFEFTVTRNYLDWLTSMPWGKFSKEKLDVIHAKEVCAGRQMPLFNILCLIVSIEILIF
jgi:ATP-dependent Lon protease